MSIKRKFNKLKRDPKSFFEDSITKQYGRAYKFVNSISKSFPYESKNSKNIVDKTVAMIGNAQINSKAQATPKLFKDYFKEITTFTQQFDVNSLELDNKKIWPYLRNNLWIHMNFVALGKNNWKNVSSVHIYNSKNTQVLPEFRRMAIEQYGARELDDLDDLDADIIFLVNMNSSEQVILEDGKIYHRVTDPFYEVAKSLAKTIKLEFIKSSSDSISLTKQYTHPTTIILPPKIERTGFSNEFKFSPVFHNTMKQFVPSLNPISNELFKENIDYEFHLREYYKDVLSKIKPKIIFLYAFHYNAPLISAADDLGILTVDIQHGLQVGWNPLYTNYDEMPEDGYPEIPDYFAVWGEKEFENIQRAFPSEKHQPIYMGAPWLEKIKKIPSSISNDILKILRNDSYKHKILIVMQNQKHIPQIYKDIINKTKDEDILWVIRHHPKCEPFLATDFSVINNNILLDSEIDSVLFSELFKYINITISEGSALAVEASYFGIVNIVTSKMGVENYQKEVDEGIFYYLESAENFENILEKIDNREDKTDTEKLFKKVDTKEFINQLLERASFKELQKSRICYLSKSEERRIQIDVETKIISNIEKAYHFAEIFELDKALDMFRKTRELLNDLPNAKCDYDREQMLWIKDARVFQRKIREAFSIGFGKEDVIVVGDSLVLPRPSEVKNINFGITRSYTYMFNNNSYGLNLLSWGQRYLTTSKLLHNWDHLIGDLNHKHLVLHLGINDSVERIFSEEQRTAMASLPTEIRMKVVKFGQIYREEIIKSQDNYSYVPYDEFKNNVNEIVRRCMDGGVKSLTFISILPFPQSHEITTPGAIDNCKRYNAVFKEASEQTSEVIYLDIEQTLQKVKNSSGVLSDNVHLSIPGHRVLAEALFSKLSILKDKEEEKVYRVVLIGVGNLGSRHLQGLAKSRNKLVIECYEPTQANIDIALERFKEIKNTNNITLKFFDNLNSLSNNIDLAIIATNSDVRAEVTESLVYNRNVKNLILEKVLFQKIDSYTKIDELIKNSNMNVWVNHPRRMFDIHNPFLNEVRKSKSLSFQVSGINWGLGSNGLHFLDLLAWLTNNEQKDIDIEWNKLGQAVTNSKRPQFKEIYGTISGVLNNEASFSITSLLPVSNELQFPTISIVSESIKLFIDEYNGVLSYAFANDNWQWHTLKGVFPLLYQSEMTTTIVDQILEEGYCILPTYKTAMFLHVPFIETIKNGIEELEGRSLDVCPIS